MGDYIFEIKKSKVISNVSGFFKVDYNADAKYLHDWKRDVSSSGVNILICGNSARGHFFAHIGGEDWSIEQKI